MKTKFMRFYKEYTGECIASIITLIACLPLFLPGHITFSDLAIGRVADEYLNYVIGVYNEQLGTPNWFNLPRLTWIAIPYAIGKVLGNSGHIFLAMLITLILLVTVFSFGSLFRRLVKNSKHPLSSIALCCGALIYALNPWVMVRIQHIFILCGYAVVPLALSWTWDALGKPAWSKTDFHVPLSKEEWRKFLLLGFVVSSSFAGIHFGIFIILCMVAMALLFAGQGLIEAFKRRCIGSWFVWYSLRGLITASTFLLFAAYWVMPFVFSITGGIRPSQNNLNAIETVVNFSRAVNPFSLLWGVSYWWPMFDPTLLPNTFWFGGGVLLSFGVVGVLYSRRLILFMMTAVVTFVATGTYFPNFAPKYIGYVFDTPYPFGDMIRDPNKLYGVFILPFAIFIAYGVACIDRFLKSKSLIKANYTAYAFSGAIGLALFGWLNPVYQIFMNGYYKPVEWPSVYDDLQDKLENLPSDSKVLYLPFADFSTDPSILVASPEFNKANIQGRLLAKSTGDHMAFDTRVDTIFPFEGNDMMVMRFLQFLHHHLDSDHIDQIGGLVAKAGITHIVMREDYTYDKERLAKHKALLDASEDLETIWANEFLTLYKVLPAQGDAQYFKHLMYTTGGFERMTWLAEYLETPVKNINVLFAYDGHNPDLSLLAPKEIVEVTAPADLWMSQLDPGRFAFPADGLRNVTPHTGWAKVILSGHDWDHASKHYKLANQKFNFDMGHGVALTNSPLAVPHKALAPPTEGISLLSAEYQSPSTFFHPFENMSIEGLPAEKEFPNKLRITVPGSVKPTEWQMLESTLFPIEELMLYHFTANLHRIDIPGVDIKYRIGYYSADGNRLGTVYADLEGTIPQPELLEFSNTFLTPKGTTRAGVEIRILNPTGEAIEVLMEQFALYRLDNYATPNILHVDIPDSPDEEDHTEEGFLWIRYLCSPKGGLVHINNDTFDETLDTICGPVSRLEWIAYPTTADFNKELSITNKTGINAINAITWLSKSEMASVQRQVDNQIANKQLLHLIDSVDFEGAQTVESDNIQSGNIGGTMRYGLNGSIETSITILKESTYTLELLDYLPFEDDEYSVSIINLETEDTVFTTTITQDSNFRRFKANRKHHARTSLPDVHLQPGAHKIVVQLSSSSRALVNWDDLDNVEVQECVIKNKAERSVTRTLPMWEKYWGSLMSNPTTYPSTSPLMIWFKFGIEASRSLHGKVRFTDANEKELSVVYLDDTARGGLSPTAYSKSAIPPDGTEHVTVQFLAKHREIPSETAKYTIGNFQLWNQSDSIGIDAIALREKTEDSPQLGTDWEDTHRSLPLTIDNTRGKRTITLDNNRNVHRLQFFEAPIHHWVFSDEKERINAFALNGFSFGLQYEGNDHDLTASIVLNSVWNRGIFYLLLGIGLLGFLFIPQRFIKSVTNAFGKQS